MGDEEEQEKEEEEHKKWSMEKVIVLQCVLLYLLFALVLLFLSGEDIMTRVALYCWPV